MRWGRLLLLAWPSLVLAGVGCASIIGIEDTTDETGAPGPDGSIDRTPTDDDGSQGDDGSSSNELPVEDASTLADVSAIDAPVTNCAETGLVARWKTNEGTGPIVADCSGNALHGLATNATWTSNGADGGALKFNGASWIGFANPALLRITGAMTISLWLRAERNTVETEYLFGKTSDATKNGYRLALLGNSPKKVVFATASSASNFNTTGGNVPLDSWLHVAAVYRPSAVSELFMNGTKVGDENNSPSALVASNAEARLGARVDGLYGFTGAISDVRVYSRALSATEISALAQR